MFFRWFILQILSCVFCCFVYSETLIIQSSDQHASYAKMLNFLASIEVISTRFKNKYPNGKIALVINGNIYSNQKYLLENLDKGNLIYEKILNSLAKKYFIVYTFGNHEAFDWNDSRLFLKQMLLLKEAGVHLVAGNVDFYPGYKNLFKAHADFVNSSGKIIRFIGYTLPYGKTQDELYQFHKKGPKIITKINDIDLNIPLETANKSEIEFIVAFMHAGVTKVKKIISALNPLKSQKLKLVFAGHDHKEKMSKVKRIHIIDSGAYFNFSTVLLNDRGEVISKHFFNKNNQKHIAAFVNMDSLEGRLIKFFREFLLYLEHVKNIMSYPLEAWDGSQKSQKNKEDSQKMKKNQKDSQKTQKNQKKDCSGLFQK